MSETDSSFLFLEVSLVGITADCINVVLSDVGFTDLLLPNIGIFDLELILNLFIPEAWSLLKI